MESIHSSKGHSLQSSNVQIPKFLPSGPDSGPSGKYYFHRILTQMSSQTLAGLNVVAENAGYVKHWLNLSTLDNLM